MTGPPVRWAVSPLDGRCHAFTVATAQRAEMHGYAEALCSHTLADRLVAANAPSGALCMPCAALVSSELPDPGRFGTTHEEGL